MDHKTAPILHICASSLTPSPTPNRHLPNGIHALHKHQHSQLWTVLQHQLILIACVSLFHILLVSIQCILTHYHIMQRRQVYSSSPILSLRDITTVFTFEKDPSPIRILTSFGKSILNALIHSNSPNSTSVYYRNSLSPPLSSQALDSLQSGISSTPPSSGYRHTTRSTHHSSGSSTKFHFLASRNTIHLSPGLLTTVVSSPRNSPRNRRSYFQSVRYGEVVRPLF